MITYLKPFFLRLLIDENGQGMVEYAMSTFALVIMFIGVERLLKAAYINLWNKATMKIPFGGVDVSAPFPPLPEGLQSIMNSVRSAAEGALGSNH